MGNGSLIGKACCWVSSLTVSFVMNWRFSLLPRLRAYVSGYHVSVFSW